MGADGEADDCMVLEHDQAQDSDSNVSWLPSPSGTSSRQRSWRRLAWISGSIGLALLFGAFLLYRNEQQLQRSPPSSAVALRSTVQLEETGSDCKGSRAWCEKGEVSLYCISQIVAAGAEEELVKAQLKHGISIFACNDFTVTCHEKRSLGKDKDGNEVHTVINPADGKAKMGDTSAGATTKSFLNVLIFMKVWDIVIKEGKVWVHDWTIKSDPDAVFFPDRMRKHFEAHTGGSHPATYLLNCREKHWKQDDKLGNGHFFWVPKLYGAIEAFNMKAMGAYKDFHKKCLNQLPWRKWGEDMYMRMCMDMLGAQKMVDYKLVGDNRCPGNPTATCSDGTRPAYHPHKELFDWFRCYNESMGLAVHRGNTGGSEASSGSSGSSGSGGAAKAFGGCGGQGRKEKTCPHGFKCHHASKWYWQCLPKKEELTNI